jgi:hypothetical protein
MKNALSPTNFSGYGVAESGTEEANKMVGILAKQKAANHDLSHSQNANMQDKGDDVKSKLTGGLVKMLLGGAK